VSDEPEDEWYWHERVRPVLEDTYGVVAFQEQLMEVCKRLANFSGGQADGMRKGVSKWYRLGKEKCIVKLREAGFETQWMKGCQENGLTAQEAWDIWDALLDWAAYGFNRSHSACYAIQGYQDMWLKTYYPHEFYASLLTLEKKQSKKKKGQEEKSDDQADFIKGVIREARIMGVEVAPPDVNRSQQGWSIDGNKILFGLASLKDVGGSAAFNPINEARPFRNYDDFIKRLPSDFSVRKAVALVKAGAFDNLDDRDELLALTRNLPAGKAQFKIKLSCGCNKTRTLKFIEDDELEQQVEELADLTCGKPDHEDGEVTEIEEVDPMFTVAAWKKDQVKRGTDHTAYPDGAKAPSFDEIIAYEREVLKIPLSVSNRVSQYAPFLEERIYTEAEIEQLPIKPKRTKKKGKTAHGTNCACKECTAAECVVGGEAISIKVIQTKRTKEHMAFVDFAFGVNQYNVTFFPYLYKQVAKLLKRPTAFLVKGHKDSDNKIIAYDIMDVIDVAKDVGWEPPPVEDELSKRRTAKKNPWAKRKAKPVLKQSKKPKIRKVA
jgi:DNA polymerase III alpha subunit